MANYVRHKPRGKTHARSRAKSRYGINLTRQDERIIADLITGKSEHARHVLDETNSKSVWVVTYNGIPMRVLFNKSKRKIITFLPKEDDCDTTDSVSDQGDEISDYGLH